MVRASSGILLFLTAEVISSPLTTTTITTWIGVTVVNTASQYDGVTTTTQTYDCTNWAWTTISKTKREATQAAAVIQPSETVAPPYGLEDSPRTVTLTVTKTYTTWSWSVLTMGVPRTEVMPACSWWGLDVIAGTSTEIWSVDKTSYAATVTTTVDLTTGTICDLFSPVAAFNQRRPTSADISDKPWHRDAIPEPTKSPDHGTHQEETTDTRRWRTTSTSTAWAEVNICSLHYNTGTATATVTNCVYKTSGSGTATETVYPATITGTTTVICPYQGSLAWFPSISMSTAYSLTSTVTEPSPTSTLVTVCTAPWISFCIAGINKDRHSTKL